MQRSGHGEEVLNEETNIYYAHISTHPPVLATKKKCSTVSSHTHTYIIFPKIELGTPLEYNGTLYNLFSLRCKDPYRLLLFISDACVYTFYKKSVQLYIVCFIALRNFVCAHFKWPYNLWIIRMDSYFTLNFLFMLAFGIQTLVNRFKV